MARGVVFGKEVNIRTSDCNGGWSTVSCGQDASSAQHGNPDHEIRSSAIVAAGPY